MLIVQLPHGVSYIGKIEVDSEGHCVSHLP